MTPKERYDRDTHEMSLSLAILERNLLGLNKRFMEMQVEAHKRTLALEGDRPLGAGTKFPRSAAQVGKVVEFWLETSNRRAALEKEINEMGHSDPS